MDTRFGAENHKQEGNADYSHQEQRPMEVPFAAKQRNRANHGHAEPWQPKNKRPAGERQRQRSDRKTRAAGRERLFAEVEADPKPRPFQNGIPIGSHGAARVRGIHSQESADRTPIVFAFDLHKILRREMPLLDALPQLFLMEGPKHLSPSENVEFGGWLDGRGRVFGGHGGGDFAERSAPVKWREISGSRTSELWPGQAVRSTRLPAHSG